MKFLLDTHTFLWWITDDFRLSLRVREIISRGENKLFLSATRTSTNLTHTPLNSVIAPSLIVW